MGKTLTENEVKELFEEALYEHSVRIASLFAFIEYKDLLDEYLKFDVIIREYASKGEYISKDKIKEILDKDGVRNA